MDIQTIGGILLAAGALVAGAHVAIRLHGVDQAIKGLAAAEKARQMWESPPTPRRDTLFSPETLVDIQRMEEMLKGLTATLGLDPLASIRPQKPAPMENTLAGEAEIPKGATITEGKTKGGMSPAIKPGDPIPPRPKFPPPSQRPSDTKTPAAARSPLQLELEVRTTTDGGFSLCCPFCISEAIGVDDEISNGPRLKRRRFACGTRQEHAGNTWSIIESAACRASARTQGPEHLKGFDCRDSIRPVTDEASGDGLAEGQFAHEDPVAKAKRLIDEDIWDLKDPGTRRLEGFLADARRQIDRSDRTSLLVSSELLDSLEGEIKRVQKGDKDLWEENQQLGQLESDIRTIIEGLPEHKEGSVIEHPVGTVVRCGRRVFQVRGKHDGGKGLVRLSEITLLREGEADGE